MVPVILSGGSGSRLWPLSRKLYPKQFLALTGQHTLFQQTLQRVDRPDMAAPIVVCNEAHRFIVAEQLQAIGCQAQSVLLEPFGRNTAPAVALAAMRQAEEGRDDLLLVLPADHVIGDVQAFHAALALAEAAVTQGRLALFGIPAERPETGYGYIRSCADPQLPTGALAVERFVEKPDLSTAEAFVASGDYLWNGGIFLFSCSRFLEELKQHAVDIYDTCKLTLERSRAEQEYLHIDPVSFACCPDDSLDCAVMEKTRHACVVPLQAAWSDVGSWSSLWDVHPKDEHGNALVGDVISHDSHNCLVHSQGKLISLVGLQDVVVVETKDAVMIAHRDRAQDVKQLVNTLTAQSRPETLNHCLVYRPWGAYDSVDKGSRFQVKRITVRPGASLSLQMHHHRAEHWIVVSGTALVTCDDKSFLLTENQSTYIPIASVHRLSNPGKIPLELIEVQSGSYLGEDDIERFEDAYGRTAHAQPAPTVERL